MRTPITYYGGKQKLASIILDMMPQHRIYVEPFFGGGAVFFAKPKSPMEVINDTNDRLINWAEGHSRPPNPCSSANTGTLPRPRTNCPQRLGV
jgi:hypothetical protein